MSENIRVFPEFCPRETKKFIQTIDWTIRYFPFQTAIKIGIKNIAYACIGCMEEKCKARKCRCKF